MLLLNKVVTGGGDTPLVSAATVGTTRSDSFNAGFEFTVGSTAITVTSIGRWKLSGNSQTHTVGVSNWGTQTDLVTTSVNLSTGTVGAFVYATCTPTVLAASTSFIVWCSEGSGDTWADYDATVTLTSVATMVGAAIKYNMFKAGGYAYGPVSLLYH